jgi:hypothetical protein
MGIEVGDVSVSGSNLKIVKHQVLDIGMVAMVAVVDECIGLLFLGLLYLDHLVLGFASRSLLPWGTILGDLGRAHIGTTAEDLLLLSPRLWWGLGKASSWRSSIVSKAELFLDLTEAGLCAVAVRVARLSSNFVPVDLQVNNVLAR